MSAQPITEQKEQCKNQDTVFNTGMKVEVSGANDGFQGSWFVATIFEQPKNEDKILVQYDTLLEQDGIGPLIEYVSPNCVRPLPPYDDNLRPFKLREVVDAFHNDRWWKGVVAELKQGRIGNYKYRVVFENPPHQIEFWPGDLRAHLDWIDHKWVKPPIQYRMKGLDLEFFKGMTVEVIFSKGKQKQEWLSAVILEEVGFNSFLVKYSGGGNNKKKSGKTIVDSFHIRHPHLNLKEASLYSCCQGQSDYLISNKERKTKVAIQLGSASIIENHIEEKIPCKNPLNDSSNFSSKLWKAKHALCTAHKDTSSSPCKKFKGEKAVDLSSSIECSENLTALEESNGEKFTSSMLTKFSSNTVVGNIPVESICPHNRKESAMEDDIMTAVEKSQAPRNSEFKLQQVSASGGDNNIELVSTETSTQSSTIDCMTKEADMVDTVIDCIVNFHPTSMVYQSHEGHSPENTQDRCNDVMHREAKTVTESHGISVEVNNEEVVNEAIPFTKSSCVWKVVESKEVFQLMPQKPHFRPLMKCKEEFREGSAIGLTMMFADMVDNTSKLQITDCRAKFDNYLATFADLEMHGFNVKPVVERLNTLLLIKDKLKQLEDKSKEVQLQITENSRENVKLEAIIIVIDKMRREMEKEKQGLYISLEKMNNCDITTLQHKESAISEGIATAQHDFESLVAATWC